MITKKILKKRKRMLKNHIQYTILIFWAILSEIKISEMWLSITWWLWDTHDCVLRQCQCQFPTLWVKIKTIHQLYYICFHLTLYSKNSILEYYLVTRVTFKSRIRNSIKPHRVQYIIRHIYYTTMQKLCKFEARKSM